MANSKNNEKRVLNKEITPCQENNSRVIIKKGVEGGE
jgi:hypothetical protein